MADLQSNDFLGTESIGKLLFRLSVPSVIAQLVNVLYNIVDRVYIGHIPSVGSAALTGVGVCFPIIMLISAFAALTAMGGAPLASIYMGKNEKAAAEKIMGNCFCALIIVSIILTAVFSIFHRPLLLLFGASENTVEYASSYISIYVLGTIFVQLALGMNSFITAQGFSKASMMSVLIGAIMNTILDPIFIFVLDMGVRGAAIATVISQCASTIWVISFLSGKKCTLRLRPLNMRISPPVLLPALALGLSPFIMQSTESVLSLCFNSSLLKYGGDIAVGSHDYSFKRHAVCHASAPRSHTGRTANYGL